MKMIKVLYLDDTPEWLDNFTIEGVKLELIVRGDIDPRSPNSAYKAPKALCEEINTLTKNKEVDLIIIGNNLGAGIAKARSVDDEMKASTIIIWNKYLKGNEIDYEHFGFRYFCSRNQLKELIPVVLASIA